MFRKWILPALLTGAFLAGGCSSRMKPVEGDVTLDGKEVDGATVVFTPVDGAGPLASGFSDANGHFVLSTAGKKGVAPGTYHVTITKVPRLGETAMKPGSPEYVAAMQKNKGPAGNPGPAAPGTGGGPKSELPKKYADVKTTPFKDVKVPLETSPMKLELSSK
jgi:hypothetical protein